DPVSEQIHPPTHRLGRRQPVEQVTRAGGETFDLVLVDRVDQRLAGGEVPVQRGDADSRLAGDGPHGRFAVRCGEHAGRHRKQLVSVAGRISAQFTLRQTDHAPVVWYRAV